MQLGGETGTTVVVVVVAEEQEEQEQSLHTCVDTKFWVMAMESSKFSTMCHHPDGTYMIWGHKKGSGSD